MGFWNMNSNTKNNESEFLWECIHNHVEADNFNKSFKFSSVRNPFSRAVSAFKHRSWSSVRNFKEYCVCIKMGEYPNASAEWHSSSLTDHLTKDGQLMVDALIRVENFQEDFNIVCDGLGIQRQPIPHANKSEHKHYTAYYDDETKGIIAEIYKDDLANFNYDFQ